MRGKDEKQDKSKELWLATLVVTSIEWVSEWVSELVELANERIESVIEKMKDEKKSVDEQVMWESTMDK